MTKESSVLLSAKNISKTYPQGSGELAILKNVSIDIQSGDAVCIVGPSGAGKSTLLHILGTLDRPSSGELYFEGEAVHEMDDEKLAQTRNQKMGFVFQFHHLLSEFTALENVMIPARIFGESKSQAQNQAEEVLGLMGLSERRHHFPSQLSGGELQRVAIARALICRPKVLFADEPTGNLDSVNSTLIQDLFFKLKQTLGLTLVVVTHDPQFAKKFSKTYRMTDGRWA